MTTALGVSYYTVILTGISLCQYLITDDNCISMEVSIAVNPSKLSVELCLYGPYFSKTKTCHNMNTDRLKYAFLII